MNFALSNVMSDIGEQWIEKHPHFFYRHRHHYHHHLAHKKLGHMLTPTGLTHQEVTLKVSPGFFCDLVCNFYTILDNNV